MNEFGDFNYESRIQRSVLVKSAPLAAYYGWTFYANQSDFESNHVDFKNTSLMMIMADFAIILNIDVRYSLLLIPLALIV